MPNKPRSEVFDKTDVGIYHCCNQIVRRRHLFGYDQFLNKDFSYRKSWLRTELRRLSRTMAVQVLDYAILDNHLHTVLRNRPDIVATWSDAEVVRRWWATCPRRRRPNGKPAKATERDLARIRKKVDACRERLSDISWVMRLAQQRVAIRANREDGVVGRFFAKRFECSRLMDEQAVVNCSLYVDLNWVHAKKAATPETSRFTSAYERIRSHWEGQARELHEYRLDEGDEFDADWLAPIYLDEKAESYIGMNEIPEETETADGTGTISLKLPEPEYYANGELKETALWNLLGSNRVSDRGFLPITLKEYLKLLDSVGRVLRKDKRGSIPKALPPILERLGLEPKRWFKEIFDEFRFTPNLARLPQG